MLGQQKAATLKTKEMYQAFRRLLELKDCDSVDGVHYYDEKDIYDALQEAMWEVEQNDKRSN